MCIPRGPAHLNVLIAQIQPESLGYLQARWQPENSLHKGITPCYERRTVAGHILALILHQRARPMTLDEQPQALAQ